MTTPVSFTVPEFCERNGMTLAIYRKLPIKPREITYGHGHTRITTAAETDWHRAMEDYANSNEARIAREARIAAARKAGLVAAANRKAREIAAVAAVARKKAKRHVPA